MRVDLTKILYDDENCDKSFVELHYELLLKLVIENSEVGNNLSNVRGALSIMENIEIVVCGPTRAGKSTLIKAITGKDVPISSSLNPDTKFSTSYRYEDSKVIFWDTQGFECWDEVLLKKFWNQHFWEKKILPSFCLFCVGEGAHANMELLKLMFENYLLVNKIPVCWVVTKSGGTDVRQTESYINEGITLLGDVTEVIKDTIAWKTEKGFIVRVNSAETKIAIPGLQEPLIIKPFGINTLINLIATNISIASFGHLIKFYKKNEGSFSYAKTQSIEVLNKFGFPLRYVLNEEEKDLFEAADIYSRHQSKIHNIVKHCFNKKNE